MRKIAGVITTFGKPDYLDKSLTSLENCVEQDTIDWFIFQDGLKNHPKNKVGYVNITEDDINKNFSRCILSTLNIKEVVTEEENRGINYQINQALSLFDSYDTLFMFEDDLVVSPYYILLLKKCSEQFPDLVATFHSIGIKNPNLDKHLSTLIKAKKPRMWGFYLTNFVWEKMKPDWVKRYSPQKRTPYYDVILTQLIRKHSKGKYQPLVSRAYNIGIDGILSTNEVSWKHRSLHLQHKEITFENDSKPGKFTIKKINRAI